MGVGWGQPQGSSPERRVVEAARRFLESGTTGNIERLREAVAAYDARPTIVIYPSTLPPGAAVPGAFVPFGAPPGVAPGLTTAVTAAAEAETDRIVRLRRQQRMGGR